MPLVCQEMHTTSVNLRLHVHLSKIAVHVPTGIYPEMLQTHIASNLEFYALLCQITVSDGCTLAYNEIGPPDGKILILIHGWSGSHRYFDLVGAGLAEQEFRVILPDLRFHGDSDKPAFGLHVHRLAADLKELLEKVAKGKKATVLGTVSYCFLLS